MNVLVIGSGGREHALVWKLSQSPRIHKIFALPGNSAIGEMAQTRSGSVSNIDEILKFAEKEKIGLTVVGPELPLTLGIVDRFEEKGFSIFGPSAAAAQIEGSKVFSKEFMKRHDIPTAEGETVSSLQEAAEAIMRRSAPYVLKAEGLAGGKGVVIASSESEALGAAENMISKKSLGDAGNRVVVESFLQGEEMSFMVITDGKKICPLPSAQDYKRVGDGNKGPNTGGMGAISPSPLLTESLQGRILEEVMVPAIRGMSSEGVPFKGVLYAGLMIIKGPKNPEKEKIYVLEFNARMGDPETQAVLPLIKTDILELFLEVSRGDLKKASLEIEDKKAVTVVMASKGYPGPFEKGKTINGLSKAAQRDDSWVFHAGTRREGARWYNEGGRVLAVTSVGNSFQDARRRVYGCVEQISFDGAHFRRDIGEGL